MNNSETQKHGYPYYPIYEYVPDGVRSTDLVALCRGVTKLTVNEKFFDPDFKRESFQETIFDEVRILSPQEKVNFNFSHILEPMEEYKGTLADYGVVLKNAIKKYLISVWDSNKPHIIFHSSGYDSRIISLALVELKNEMGRDWIGKIHFRCHGSEGESFLEIMQLEGWDKSEYSVFIHPPMDYYDLGYKDRPVNGFVSFVGQMNFWRDIISRNEEKDWVLVTGLGGGEQFDYPSKHFKTATNFNYCNNPNLNRFLNYFQGEGEWVGQWYNQFGGLLLPYFSYEYLSKSMAVPSKFLKVSEARFDVVRASILNSYALKLLNVAYRPHEYLWGMSDERKAIIQTNSDNSLFFEKYGERFKDIDFHIRRGLPAHRYETKIWGFMTLYDAIFGHIAGE